MASRLFGPRLTRTKANWKTLWPLSGLHPDVCGASLTCGRKSRPLLSTFPTYVYHSITASTPKTELEVAWADIVFEMFFFVFSSHSSSSHIFFSLSFPLVSQIRGHIEGSSPPFPLRYYTHVNIYPLQAKISGPITRVGFCLRFNVFNH